ncbi:hypothetical protein A5784_14145 [Mycobacterium sp. 852013-50091_SCH5140682]|uniref:hypothetical protein n=1 Tax=Mycobacterium sp. 852013-50091_SCH5140682 TaxID=1834109 RepID=UPI0007E969B3|nr:hypothetical protein [Mycobacterium sp. 852013-50091_SCH5140682]OBC03370.1 hypothetical protein A5784_14145 [Mycobacterium sp. 852013-50091_SCH5140682]
MPCDWPIDRTCLPELPVPSDTPTADEQAAYDLALVQRNAAEDRAVFVLWALSGRQFGVCETKVRPCPENLSLAGYAMPWASPFVLTLDEGHWFNWPCGCVGSCTVSGPRVVHLPGPVAEVTAVTIDGVVLDPDEYQVEGNVLYRKGTSWPRQDLGRPLGESGTWSVTYTRGNPVPPGVAQLVGLLAKEFMVACDPSGTAKCRLPRTVVSTTRQGVTHVFDPAKMLAAGKTGLPEVDSWLAAANPNHLAQAPEVL